ncbi:MAG: tetratricopeptide repeat protein [Gloeotrichia echinulata CP02]
MQGKRKNRRNRVRNRSNRQNTIISSDCLETLKNQAEELDQAGDYEGEIALYKQHILLDPHNVNVLRRYSKALAEVNPQDKKAIKYIKKALRIDPMNVDVLRNYGEILAKREEFEPSFKKFEKALKLKKDDIKVLTSYASALKKDKQFEKAIPFLKQVVELEPENYKSLTNLAFTFLDIKQYEDARDVFDQVISREFDYTESKSNTFFGIACELQKYKQTDIAFDYFEQAIELEPDNAKYLANYANALTSAGEYEKALEFFEKSLKIDPNNEKTRKTVRTIAYHAIKEPPQEALKIFEKLIQLDSDNIQTRITYVNLVEDNNYARFRDAKNLENVGQNQQAIEQLEKINLDTLHQYHAIVILMTLGRLYYRIKSLEKGEEYFELAMANSDDKDRTCLYIARSILVSGHSDHYRNRAVERLKQIPRSSPRYDQAAEMLILNQNEEDFFNMVKMVKTETQNWFRDTVTDTEALNAAMYHKIANEIAILKGIAHRILRLSEQEDPQLRDIIECIENVFTEVNKKKAAQKNEIENIPTDDYGNILAVISKTAHDISDFVNNQLAVIESKTRRAMRKLQPSHAHYAQFEKLLTLLEQTQTALNDLKAINEGITIKNHRFKVKKLFEKWETTPQIEQAEIVVDIQNGDFEFNGDEEKIKSALNELVENSLKHNFGQNLEIKITSRDVINPSVIRGRTIPGEDKYLFIEFVDNGKGIPEDRKEWIFQPLKTTSQEGNGSGLGLFIIRKTLSKMNGYILETGRNGARFEIYIRYTK